MRYKNIIGSRVAQARKASNPVITQKDLVARLEVLGIKIDQASISKLEGGKRPVSDIEVVALAKALKVPVEQLLEDTGYFKDFQNDD